jgi:hypothetical protein
MAAVFRRSLITAAMLACFLAAQYLHADTVIHFQKQGTNALIQIEGDHDKDWRIQVSSNLASWDTWTNFGTLISGGQITNAPWRSISALTNQSRFFRALKTDGLFDHTLFRSINITFTQANWPTLLVAGRTFETNTSCTVFLDNGATNFSVGARYKGNTSYTQSGTKKSINLEFDWKDTNADLMTYQTVNLNNAAGDETIMREALYFNVMSQYTPCPQGAMCRVIINGNLWGVYSLVQQENSQLVQQWFPSATGDRWRAPNAPGGGQAGFASSNSAFSWFGTNVTNYYSKYQLKTDNSLTNIAWQRLVFAISNLNVTATNVLRDVAENAWTVDDWLWFLAIENIFADDDSYWNKGADYGFYFEPESSRIHPIEHDGNEAFVVSDSALSPLVGLNATYLNTTLSNRPLIYRLLAINELRQRYLAHMRTLLAEFYNPAMMTPLIDAYHRLSIDAILVDTNRGFTMTAYTNDFVGLKQFVTNRYNFLSMHADVRPQAPVISAVTNSPVSPAPLQSATITARVLATTTNGMDSVWLYHRGAASGRFTAVQMFDDGAHNDGGAGDNVFGATTTNYPSGTKVRYYIEARSANAAKAASFLPARAEHDTFTYRVSIPTATNTPVVINEFMASNTSTLADPQGEFDDWIELHNITDAPVEMTGRYLSDEPNNPRKWQFPVGTTIPAQGYLLIWADEDTLATPGLHASFKLNSNGETIFLTDTDANLNAVLDSIEFGTQQTERSYGRSSTNTNVWVIMNPSPSLANE